MDQEEWVFIAGFTFYEVSNQGRVRNSRGGLLKPSVNPQGKLQVVLRRDGKSYCRAVHKLVAKEFLSDPPRNDVHLVVHKNSDVTDNRAENLQWVAQWRVTYFQRQARRGGVPLDDREVMITATGERFRNCLELANAFGRPEEQVLNAAYSGTSRGRYGSVISTLAFVDTWD